MLKRIVRWIESWERHQDIQQGEKLQNFWISIIFQNKLWIRLAMIGWKKFRWRPKYFWFPLCHSPSAGCPEWEINLQKYLMPSFLLHLSDPEHFNSLRKPPSFWYFFESLFRNQRGKKSSITLNSGILRQISSSVSFFFDDRQHANHFQNTNRNFFFWISKSSDLNLPTCVKLISDLNYEFHCF